MKKVLVVQQFLPPGSAQDQQRGDMYAPVYRAHCFEPRYLGRKPAYARWLSRRPEKWARIARESLPYKLGYRVAEATIRSVNDQRVLGAAARSDVVQLIKVNSVPLVRSLRRRTRARLVFDLADALWLPQHAKEFGDVKEILRTVDAVTCDNRFGVAYARGFNSSVHLWPPASQVELFDTRRAARARDPHRVTVGWVGSAGTASNLYLILESLEDVFKRHPELHLRLVGLPPDHPLLRCFEHVSYSCVPAYDRDEMVEELLGVDIGLFPMFDLEESRTHGITKGLVYMAAGAAVVASPVGECPDLIASGKTGLLATGREAWTEALEALVSDPRLRTRLAEAGLAKVRVEYSLERCFASMRPALGA